MVYSDRARPDVVYLTQASFQADFNTPGSVKPIVGTVFLDATSTPKVRRRRYVDRVAESTR